MMTVKEVRELALKNYEEGGDIIIECWTDEDIQEFIDKHKKDTRKELGSLFGLYDERRRAIENTKF